MVNENNKWHALTTETESKDTLDQFVTTMKKIAADARAGKADEFYSFPQSSPRKRLDEVKAARNPVLKYMS